MKLIIHIVHILYAMCENNHTVRNSMKVVFCLFDLKSSFHWISADAMHRHIHQRSWDRSGSKSEACASYLTISSKMKFMLRLPA